MELGECRSTLGKIRESSGGEGDLGKVVYGNHLPTKKSMRAHQ